MPAEGVRDHIKAIRRWSDGTCGSPGILHPDHGCQYTSLAFSARCQQAGVRPSRGTVATVLNNAMCKNLLPTLECKLIGKRSFHTQAQTRQQLFRYIDGWYNHLSAALRPGLPVAIEL